MVYTVNMNNNEIKELYTIKDWSLRRIAEVFNTNHHKIKRILTNMNIQIEKKPRKPFTDEHRRNISTANKGRASWAKGKKMPKDSLYKNMASHLRFDIEYNWLLQFEDVEKLKFLNGCITNRSGRFDGDTDWYKSYILRFYKDEQFNNIYNKWLDSNDEYLRPTIDHINPKANGGNNDIDNLQFLTWFENRAKNDMSQERWNSMKKQINNYLL